MTKTEAKVRSDPRIEAVEVNEDGFWAYTKPGFHDGYDEMGRTHGIHEDSWSAVLRQMRSIRPCDCADCKRPRAK
jgi:hypothetical protein